MSLAQLLKDCRSIIIIYFSLGDGQTHFVFKSSDHKFTIERRVDFMYL